MCVRGKEMKSVDVQVFSCKKVRQLYLILDQSGVEDLIFGRWNRERGKIFKVQGYLIFLVIFIVWYLGLGQFQVWMEEFSFGGSFCEERGCVVGVILWWKIFNYL